MEFPGFIRALKRGEEDAVADLLTDAFGRKDEAELVSALRAEGVLASEMVLPMGEGVIGYYALSEMQAPKGWLCLAPIAISPRYQRHGYARRMLKQLSEWARLSHHYVVVLGEPGLYSQAGFSSARAAQLTSPFPITYTLLAGPGTDVPELSLVYPKAFGSG